MKLFTLELALLPVAFAFPASINPEIPKRAELNQLLKRANNATQAISQAQTNCGPTPCLVFSATEQYVSTTGSFAYASPKADEIRGPCPGLNAAANHGYLPRSGVATIPETITGLGELYGISPDLAGFLAAYAVIYTGDVVTQTWSIGGPMELAITPLGYPPQGLSYSHNKYESDTSIARGDAYMNNGDAHSLNLDNFRMAYELGMDDDRYTLDKFRVHGAANQYYSIRNNPYYFAPLFSTTLVAPAAYNFVINFMSNHSAAEPSGYLNGEMFKQFFAINGTYPNFEWLPGQERIPENWYRRPSASQYNIPNVFEDVGIGWAAYPNTFRLGGNTNGVNTYKGVDIATLSKGAYTNDNVFQGDNFACLFFQIQQQAVPDELKGLVNDVAAAMQIFDKYFSPYISNFTCGQLAGYDNSVFNAYPGRTYSPTGPATNY